MSEEKVNTANDTAILADKIVPFISDWMGDCVDYAAPKMPRYYKVIPSAYARLIAFLANEIALRHLSMHTPSCPE